MIKKTLFILALLFPVFVYAQEAEYASFLDESTGLFGFSPVSSGKIIIKPVYEDAGAFNDGLAGIVN